MAMTNEEYKKLASKCRVTIHSDGGHFQSIEVYHAKTGFTYKVRREEVDTDSSWLATKMLLDKLYERLEGKI